jgi:hypothetical protein
MKCLAPPEAWPEPKGRRVPPAALQGQVRGLQTAAAAHERCGREWAAERERLLMEQVPPSSPSLCLPRLPSLGLLRTCCWWRRGHWPPSSVPFGGSGRSCRAAVLQVSQCRCASHSIRSVLCLLPSSCCLLPQAMALRQLQVAPTVQTLPRNLTGTLQTREMALARDPANRLPLPEGLRASDAYVGS